MSHLPHRLPHLSYLLLCQFGIWGNNSVGMRAERPTNRGSFLAETIYNSSLQRPDQIRSLSSFLVVSTRIFFAEDKSAEKLTNHFFMVFLTRWHRAQHTQHTQVILCSHNTDGACRAIYVFAWTKCVILAKHWLAPWWWFPCEPKHVRAAFLILVCFNKLYMCISWTIKGLDYKGFNHFYYLMLKWRMSGTMPPFSVSAYGIEIHKAQVLL